MIGGKRVLVAGATGYLGHYAARELKSRGWTLRVLGRSAEKLGSLSSVADEVVVGQVTNPDSIRGICSKVDAVFSSIGITQQNHGLTYMDVDYQGNLNLLREAQKAGVSKFVHISVFNAENM